jgi:hypothetical protein
MPSARGLARSPVPWCSGKRPWSATVMRTTRGMVRSTSPRGRSTDFDRLGSGNGHEQRRMLASAGPDLVGAPIADRAGGVMTRSESGQVTVKFPAQRTCPSGHPIEFDVQKFCTVWGGPIRAPELGEVWQDTTLAQERRRGRRDRLR